MRFAFLKLIGQLPLEVCHGASVATQRAVLKELCFYADENGICWPKLKTVSQAIHRSRRCTYLALRALEDQGYLTRLGYAGRGRATERRINIAKIEEMTPDDGREKGATTDQKGATNDTKGATNGIHKGHTQRPVSKATSSSRSARSSSSDHPDDDHNHPDLGLVRVTPPDSGAS